MESVPFKILPVPKTMLQGETDDFGLLHGCRDCGERPASVVSFESDESISVPWCGQDKCRDQVNEIALELLLSNRKRKSAFSGKRSFFSRLMFEFGGLAAARDMEAETNRVRLQ